MSDSYSEPIGEGEPGKRAVWPFILGIVGIVIAVLYLTVVQGRGMDAIRLVEAAVTPFLIVTCFVFGLIAMYRLIVGPPGI